MSEKGKRWRRKDGKKTFHREWTDQMQRQIRASVRRAQAEKAGYDFGMSDKELQGMERDYDAEA